MSKILSSFAIALIRAYQLVLSPLLPPSCKYHPSCSQYAIEALRRYGVLRGSVLAAWRILRCNPWSHGGYDPVERQTLFRSRAPGPAPADPADTASPMKRGVAA